MSWTGFGDLDLTGVDADTGSARLREGSYRVKCTEAAVEPVEGTKNRKVVATLVDEDGHGDIRVNFNIFHTNEQAMDIGRRQLKGFLEVSGHPNPDKPGDIKSLVGLRCAIIVGMGKPYKGSDGKERQNTEVKKFMTPDTPVSGPAPVSSARVDHHAIGASKGGGGVGRRDMDDEIPFSAEWR